MRTKKITREETKTVATLATLAERERWQKLAIRQNLTLSQWLKKAAYRYERELAPVEKQAS